LCFSFTKPGRRELRERKEKKWIKVAVWLRLSDPAPSSSLLENRQVGQHQQPGPVWGCYAL
jgi:hypothetical protein